VSFGIIEIGVIFPFLLLFLMALVGPSIGEQSAKSLKVDINEYTKTTFAAQFHFFSCFVRNESTHQFFSSRLCPYYKFCFKKYNNGELGGFWLPSLFCVRRKDQRNKRINENIIKPIM
jgi:hypothetical protein